MFDGFETADIHPTGAVRVEWKCILTSKHAAHSMRQDAYGLSAIYWCPGVK